MSTLFPGQTIGIIGDNQAAYLLGLKAKQMGYKIAALIPNTTSPMIKIADQVIFGQYERYTALEELAQHSDVVTYTDEFIDPELLARLGENYDLPQGHEILEVTQDRYFERTFLNDLKSNVVPYVSVFDADDVRQNIASIGYPCVIKPIQKVLGNKHQKVLRSEADLAELEGFFTLGAYLMESWLDTGTALSVTAVKDTKGQVLTYPTVENQYQSENLRLSLLPARIFPEVAVEVARLTTLIGENLNYQGVFCVEFFLMPDGNLYVRRIIPKPSFFGDVLNGQQKFDQYANHLRVMCELPLAPISELQRASVSLRLQQAQLPEVKTQLLIKPDWLFNLYFDTDNQQLGHLNINHATLQPILEKLQATNLLPNDLTKGNS